MSESAVVTRPPPDGARVGLSGLTEPEARDFQRAFTVSFLLFLGIAIVAHWLVWQWRPWIPGAEGYPVAEVTEATGAPPATAVAVR